MTERRNDYDQPLGESLPAWTARALPPESPAIGRYCRLERIDPARHAADLYAAFAEAPDLRDWTYMFAGPFTDYEGYAAYLRGEAAKRDPFHHAIVDTASGKAIGSAAYSRIDPAHGVIEVGAVTYSRALQRSRAGTEAMFLMMRRAFDELGYRRYEWKCDSLNAPSRRAAERYGFQYEGTFRQAVVYRGRNRDTAWFSIIDRDWPALRAAFERWLDPENFDGEGRQHRSLTELRGL
ncbi:MAG TPA: GNAT family protein [Alphaproteobacteria bacterium]|jgi:RimJ/RimL family protein N-acetyltransferase